MLRARGGMVDTVDLKSTSVSYVGSSPTGRTTNLQRKENEMTIIIDSSILWFFAFTIIYLLLFGFFLVLLDF